MNKFAGVILVFKHFSLYEDHFKCFLLQIENTTCYKYSISL